MLGFMGHKAWAIGAVLLSAGLTRADDDTYRLGGRVDDAPVQRLDQRSDDDEAETTLTARYGGGFARGGGGRAAAGGFARGGGGRVAAGGFARGGGGRSFAGGFVRGGGGGRAFVGGFRGGWGWRGGWGGRGNVGWRAGWGWRGGWGGGGVFVARPWFGPRFGVSVGFPIGGVCGCSSFQSDFDAPPLTMQLQPVPPMGNGAILPSPRMNEPKGPFPYDGGPIEPVPMPKLENQPKVQGADRFVSMPAAKKYEFAAYGDKQGLKVPPADNAKDLYVKVMPRN